MTKGAKLYTLPNPNEKRRYVRERLKSPAVLRLAGGESFDAEIQDLSPEGVLIHVPEGSTALEEHGVLEFLLVGRGTALSFPVRIRWRQNRGVGDFVGLRFDGPSHSQLASYWKQMPEMRRERVI